MGRKPKDTLSYPLDLLRKSQAILEANIRGGIPGMYVSDDDVAMYTRCIRQLKTAIGHLELQERIEKAYRASYRAASRRNKDKGVG